VYSEGRQSATPKWTLLDKPMSITCTPIISPLTAKRLCNWQVQQVQLVIQVCRVCEVLLEVLAQVCFYFLNMIFFCCESALYKRNYRTLETGYLLLSLKCNTFRYYFLTNIVKMATQSTKIRTVKVDINKFS